jgi:DNA-binding CsgD family transcriptional regulator
VRLLKFIIYVAFISIVSAQERPPIQSYTTDDYSAQSQNWAISQDENNVLYVANNQGLLVFNGANWELFASPNESIIRSVHVVGDKIYTGCYMEFGFWEKNVFGKLEYNSLSNNDQVSLIEDEQVWNILNIDQWVLFQTLNRIYIYDTLKKTFKIINSNTRLTKVFSVGKEIYFQKLFNGIYKLENGNETLVTNNPLLIDNTIVNVFQHNGKLLFQTQKKGFYFLEEGSVIKWKIPADNLLDNITAYSGIQLKDKSFVVGSISSGFIHITSSGEVNFTVNQSNGLSNNTVLSLYEDNDENIWLALDNGINCINMKSPYHLYNDINGELGFVYKSEIYKEVLYLGTNQGLFYKKNNSSDKFKLVKGMEGQVWDLTVINNQLFCGHDNGTYIVSEGIANKISNIQGTWSVKNMPNNENLLIQGNYLGLFVLQKQGASWKYKNKIEGFNMSSRYFEFIDDNKLILNHEYKGVFELEINDDYTQVVNIKRQNSVDKGINSSLAKYDNEIIYAYKEGIYKYDLELNEFVKDSFLSNAYTVDEYLTGKLVVDKHTNKLWSFTKDDLIYITPGKLSDNPEINKIPIPNILQKGSNGFENILHLGNDKYLYGTSSGYFIIDINEKIHATVDITLNYISNFIIDEESILVDKTSVGIFNSNANNLKFDYSIAEFEKYVDSEYQYQLIGLYDNWSQWSTNSNVLFENLPFGDYTFNVRAKAGNKVSKNIETYSFTIDRPWYLSNLSLVFYSVGLLLIFIADHNLYKSYYKKQRKSLIEKTQRELELSELENKQELIKLKNEKLKQDVENKSRELAISTMSLIKKNEFLNDIKNELNKIGEGNKIKSVISIIDQNLNNTDDWNLFEEAFNNADKNFLKKVKKKHPQLTPNDLKLCAYLRLNLSSKEIAPLLNISPRSVEVKRYRLRKKINLPHETSLTNYILEL